MVELDVRFRYTWYSESQYKQMKKTRERYTKAGVLFNPFTIKTKLVCGIDDAQELYEALEDGRHEF